VSDLAFKRGSTLSLAGVCKLPAGTWYDASATATYNLAKTVTVPADATLVVVDKEAPIYLEEGDKISAVAATNSDLEITISFEEIS
jgi:hypothetical protein